MLKIEIDIKRKEESKMKKWLSVLLAAVMLLAMAGIAGAVDTPTGTITVGKLQKWEVVDLYQVIEMEFDKTKGQYNEVKWSAEIQAWIDSNAKYKGMLPENAPTGDSNDAKNFYSDMYQYVMENSGKFTPVTLKMGEAKGAIDFKNQKAGSYLIAVHGGANIHQPYLASLQPQGNATTGLTLKDCTVDASQKSETPKIEKSVNKIDIGVTKTVTFTITTTVPKYSKGAKNIKYWISDAMDSNLTFIEGTLKVKLDGTIINEQDEYTKAEYEGNASEGKKGLFTLKFDYDKIKNAQQIAVTYDAEGSAAIVPGNGYENEATFEWTDGSDSKTQKVYTYGLIVEKKDKKTKDSLDGVEFELKQGENAKTDSLKFKKVGNVYKLAKDGEDGSSAILSTVGGKIQIDGLELGKYTLVETKPKDGYNSVAPETFELKADDNKPQKLSEDADAYHQITVLNSKGMSIPSTGGVGTTIFMVAGIGVMACAVAALMLVLKRQKKNEG